MDIDFRQQNAIKGCSGAAVGSLLVHSSVVYMALLSSVCTIASAKPTITVTASSCSSCQKLTLGMLTMAVFTCWVSASAEHF